MNDLPSTFFERHALRAVEWIFAKIEHGHLTVDFPDGTRKVYGNESAPPAAALRVRRWSFFTRLARDGDVGLGEAYMAEDFTADDLTGLIRLFIENEDALSKHYARAAWLGRIFNRLGHWLRANSLRGSRENIHAHYDLSNRLFETFLDPSMTYSCAYYKTPEDSLEEAQRRKRMRILRKARIRPEHRVLEIGSGWGSFAIDAARETGCRVTTVTLSAEQLELARERVAAAGLRDKVSVELRDYRAIEGKFDRIVSIEMIEAVGHEYYGDYFRAIDRLLDKNGLAVIQAITMPDHLYDASLKGCDWIQKHIFPGSRIPSLYALSAAMTANSRLMVEDLENIGVHYVRTLRDWRKAFLAGQDRLLAHGFDAAFRRKWEYYLAYSEAGFASRILGDIQLVLTRPNNKSLPAPC